MKVTLGRRPCDTAPGQAAAAPPAPVSQLFSGSYIAEIKFIGKGVKEHYKPGAGAQRGVDARAKAIPGEYKGKAREMDVAMGVREGEEGPCQRRLGELPLLSLCWGAYGEGSPGVHILVSLLAACRVRSLALRGSAPSPHQMGMEVATVRRRLSLAAIMANNTVLLARLRQVGGEQLGQQEESLAEEGGETGGASEGGGLAGGHGGKGSGEERQIFGKIMGSIILRYNLNIKVSS